MTKTSIIVQICRHIFSLHFFFIGAISTITKGPTNVTVVYTSSTAAREDQTFECIFDGTQNVSVQWFYSSTLLSNSSDYSISNYDNSSVLTIFNVTVSDIGTYICNASSDVAAESREAYLDVIGKL